MTLPTEGQSGHLQKHADIDTLIAGHTSLIAAGDVTNPASAAGIALSATIVDGVRGRGLLGSSIAFFGDSITNYGEGYAFYAATLSGGKFNASHIQSNPGWTSTQLLTVIDAQIVNATPKPTGCLILCGANDAQAQTPLATFKANIKSMVQSLRLAGIAPILGTITPNNSGVYDAFVRTYNVWLMRFAELEKLPLVDFYTMGVNQAAGGWKAAYNSGDGLHPSVAGNKAMGAMVASTLAPLLIPRPYVVQPFSGTPNLIPNSNYLVDDSLDGLANGLYATPSSGFAYSLVPDPAGFNWQRMTLTGAAGPKKFGSTELTGWAVGDRLRFSVRLRSGQDDAGTGSTPAAPTGVFMNFTCFKTGYSGITYNAFTTGLGMSRQIDGIITAEFVVPPETAIVLYEFTGGPTNGTYDHAQPTLHNLTALGAE